MADRFTGRALCMDDPTLFDQELPGESVPESNARMERAANLCRSACSQFQACQALYPPTAQRRGGVSGVVAGRYAPRRGTRKTTAAYGRYTDGHPCTGCGNPMIVDTEADPHEVPDGFVLRYKGSKCKTCHYKWQTEYRREKRMASA